MLGSQGSAKFENGKVTCCKNKICRAISREAYLAYFLMFLILEFFPQTAFSRRLKFTNNFEIKQFMYLVDWRDFSKLSNSKPDLKSSEKISVQGHCVTQSIHKEEASHSHSHPNRWRIHKEVPISLKHSWSFSTLTIIMESTSLVYWR
jgi:hypothetical protein